MNETPPAPGMPGSEPFITAPGVYDIGEEDYHADRLCAAPSLSRSIAVTLLHKTPRHAWTDHLRLNPDWKEDNDKKFDVGHACHARVLRGQTHFAVIEHKDYKTNAAKAARDAALAAGKMPLKQTEHENVMAMYEALQLQLAGHRDVSGVFLEGTPEQTLIWQDQARGSPPVWLRIKLDWLPPAHVLEALAPIIVDYKTTGGSAGPRVWGRHAFDMGYDIQAAFYSRGLNRVLGVERARFIFLVQENKPPYAMAVYEMDPEAIALAERKVDYAIGLWAHCLKHNDWPGYPGLTMSLASPVWETTRWESHFEQEQFMRTQGQDLKDLLLHWQQPFTTAPCPPGEHEEDDEIVADIERKQAEEREKERANRFPKET